MTVTNTSLNILVAGGAGYIGSVTTASLIEAGHNVTVIDNFSSGHSDAIHPDARYIQADIADSSAVDKICSQGIDFAMHFAAFIEVGISVREPSLFYDNNLVKSISLINKLAEHGVKGMVFSSTAAVYGYPEFVPLTEKARLAPINPYGQSKMMVETILKDFDRAYGFKFVSLRYFNAGGAHGFYGEDHDPESHLIPLIFRAIDTGIPLKVFGDDYDTVDGSCIRDYIHVRDLAQAHMCAVSYMLNGGSSDIFNLGTGTGYSVLEVIHTVERVTGREVPYEITERRPGDSPELVASPAKAHDVLNWKKDLSSLDDIVFSAWEWKQRFPHGYEK
ncbi:MAG: UDP-glucose 4-epimerase GalE [Candidatus Latescibacteria bacterium]|nr:UDP-glucose 4-epimerase GalE [Candidatus Latescibacterota bacterium]